MRAISDPSLTSGRTIFGRVLSYASRHGDRRKFQVFLKQVSLSSVAPAQMHTGNDVCIKMVLRLLDILHTAVGLQTPSRVLP